MTTKVGTLLEQFMLGAKVDDATLSAETKVAKANISRLKNDPKANPTLATLKPLAAFFGVTVSQLLGEEPLTQVNEKGQVLSRLPILSWDDVQTNLTGHYFGVTDWLSVEYQVSEFAFALKVSDKTLIPIFPVGAILIIDKQTVYEDGMHVLVRNNEGDPPFLRQYLIDGNMKLLRSLKLGTHWSEPLSDSLTLIGAVLEVRFNRESF